MMLFPITAHQKHLVDDFYVIGWVVRYVIYCDPYWISVWHIVTTFEQVTHLMGLDNFKCWSDAGVLEDIFIIYHDTLQ